MKNTGADYSHQYLVIGNARSFVHSVQPVQKAQHFPLIEKWNRGKDGAAKGVLHKDAKLLFGQDRARVWIRALVGLDFKRGSVNNHSGNVPAVILQ